MISKFKFYLLLLFITISTDISIIFNLFAFKQVLSSFFLLILPGLLLLRVLKYKITNLFEFLCYSIGLSISFNYFFGFILNSFHWTLQLNSPLSIQYLLPFYNIVILIFGIVAYKYDIPYVHIPYTRQFIDPLPPPYPRRFIDPLPPPYPRQFIDPLPPPYTRRYIDPLQPHMLLRRNFKQETRGRTPFNRFNI